MEGNVPERTFLDILNIEDIKCMLAAGLEPQSLLYLGLTCRESSQLIGHARQRRIEDLKKLIDRSELYLQKEQTNLELQIASGDNDQETTNMLTRIGDRVELLNKQLNELQGKANLKRNQPKSPGTISETASSLLFFQQARTKVALHVKGMFCCNS